MVGNENEIIVRAAQRVHKKVRRFIDLDELISIGWIGFLEEEPKYDVSRNRDAFVYAMARFKMLDFVQAYTPRKQTSSLELDVADENEFSENEMLDALLKDEPEYLKKMAYERWVLGRRLWEISAERTISESYVCMMLNGLRKRMEKRYGSLTLQ
jgi:DNA-directed RNA polymerase specialized sigma subunit